MPSIQFLFVGEGSSDLALVSHLEALCVHCGAEEAVGVAPDLRSLPTPVGTTVREKVEMALRLEPNANLVFVHRDSDSRDPEPRYQEIERQVTALRVDISWVAVVPVREIEAWLLLDDPGIRRIAGNPRGTQQLQIPTPAEAERLADPKARLKSTLSAASGLTGTRLAQFNRAFPRHRRRLLEALGCNDPVRGMPSWQRLVHDITTTIQHL